MLPLSPAEAGAGSKYDSVLKPCSTDSDGFKKLGDRHVGGRLVVLETPLGMLRSDEILQSVECSPLL